MHSSSVSKESLSNLDFDVCVEMGFSQTEKFNWRQLVEHTDVNQIIAGSID